MHINYNCMFIVVCTVIIMLQQYVHGLAERWKMMPEEDKEVFDCFSIIYSIWICIPWRYVGGISER
jgi:hypothetical protein